MKVFTSKTQKIGEEGENAAALFLEHSGFTVTERNTSNRYGEIDIIAKKQGILYFFEVKAGNSNSWLNPAENLTKAKLKKLFSAIGYYCLTHGIRNYRVQGIVVVFEKNGEVRIEMIELF